MDPRSQVESIKMQMISDRLRTKALSAATLAGAIAITALLAPHTVRAGEYCSRDVDFMNNCSFSSMEQYKASVSGTDGECCPNPSSKHTSIANINRNAYAYSPLPIHGGHIRRGSATNTKNERKRPQPSHKKERGYGRP